MRAIEPERRSIQDKEGIAVANCSRLFVGGIPIQVTRQELATYFEAFGPLQSVNLSTSEATPELNKGFGFVVFERGSDAKKAILLPKNHVLRSKVVR